SGLGGDTVRIIEEAPGIERSPEGPNASPELFVIVGHPLKRSPTTVDGQSLDANVPLRGLTPAFLRVRHEVKIVEGRMFEPGTNEIIVGRAAANQFRDMNVGRSFRWGEASWTIVGIFEANGSVAESELWCDARVLQPAYRRGNSYQSVFARLENRDAFQTLKDALTTDPRLNVTVMRETDYYAAQSRVMQMIIRTIGFGIAALMGLGAIFGAVNTMYSA